MLNLSLNSTANIHRRFRRLFHLPSLGKIILYALATSSLIPIVFFTQEERTASLLATLPAFEGLLVTAVLVQRLILRGNPLATVRRLTAVSFLSNLLWLLMILLGLAFPSKRQHLVVLGLFFASSFNLLVFASALSKRFSEALILSLLQPLSGGLLLTPPIFSDPYRYSGAYLAGITVLSTVLILLYKLERTGRRYLPASPLRLLQAFLKAWACRSPDEIEGLIEKMSIPNTVTTHLITFNRNQQPTPLLVIPGVHPGPMYPIGSCNLPHQLFGLFSDKGYSPLVFHGISDHELNLPSKEEVRRYLSSLDIPTKISEGSSCSKPITLIDGKATVSGIAFNDIALLIITMAPHGMEDFPRRVRDSIADYAKTLGFKDTVIIDAHNSIGRLPSEEECSAVVQASRKLLVELKKAPQYPFTAGLAHSSEIGLTFDEDVGPAGLGGVVIEAGGEGFAIVNVDANNAPKGLREEIMRSNPHPQIRLLEICTSDTHFAAGQVMNPEGYSLLGTKTPPEQIIKAIDQVINRATSTAQPSSFTAYSINSQVKVFGPGTLENFSKTLDKVGTNARRGGLLIILLSLSLLATLLLA